MKPQPFIIGKLIIDPPVMLAPMAGYTDSVFRSICKKYHCPVTLTEVVNAEGTIRGGHQTLHLLETNPGERPIGAHIYGADPDRLAAAAIIIEKTDRFDFIDINCGCPVPKIVRKGAGVALMRTPEKIERIVYTVKSAVSLPVTVKTRIGLSPDKMNIHEVSQAVEAGGASAIFIHARFASQRHSGEANWEILARIKSEMSIPVIGNGGISCVDDVFRMFSQTRVDGVMIGRAAVGNPWFFDEIYCRVNNLPWSPHSLEEHRAIIMEHLENLVLLKQKEYRYKKKNSIPVDQAASLHFRAHLHQYLRGFHGWPQIRRNLNTMHRIENIREAVDWIIAKQKSLS
ncbi:MAG: tRNA-dihydrouridine synthase family protein [Kiritimatiellae bacterium]|nr:tRNA-dihydrouridine synthase family protein [Kiritimatiellia bacterium]MDD5519357.1 tRNA-dihydrouridine synthase family protein [Kiritimatiellia bacterium]